VLARSYDGALRLVDFADPAKPVERALAAKASAATFLPDGRLLVGGPDGTLRLWTPDGAEAGVIRASDASIGSLAVSRRYVASVDAKLAVRLWQPEGRSFGRPLAMRRQRVDIPCTTSAVAIAPDETAVAAISCTGDVYVWTLAGQAVAVPRGRGGYEGCCGWQIGFSADGKFLIARRSGQPGYDAYVWTRRGGALAGGRLFPGSDQLSDFAVLPNTPELLILDAVGLRRLAPGGGPKGAVLVPQEADRPLRSFAVSADGTRIATIEGDGDIVYRAGDGKILGRSTLR
jgi:WD40 repeat protein